MLKQLRIGGLLLPNNLILAPMAGITDLPVRLLAREQGAGLCFTEMVSVNGLVREGKKSFGLLRSTVEDRPLGIQIFGDDPQTMAEGAELVTPYGDLLDINMGCPVKKVVSSGAGSALLRDPLRVAAIVREVRRRVSLPVTVKIRTGWGAGDANFLEIGRIAQEEGADAVTLHPRTRVQMFEGKADREKLDLLKAHLSVPVIGSGDVFTPADAADVLSRCDGVMIARGGLGNPWLFRDIRSFLENGTTLPPTPAERHAASQRHLEILTELAGEAVALREMRKHLSWYARGVSGAARFRACINTLSDAAAMGAEMAAFFGG